MPLPTLQNLIQASRQASEAATKAAMHLPHAGPDTMALCLLQDNPAAAPILPLYLREEHNALTNFHAGNTHPSTVRQLANARIALRAWAYSHCQHQLADYLSYVTDNYPRPQNAHA